MRLGWILIMLAGCSVDAPAFKVPARGMKSVLLLESAGGVQVTSVDLTDGSDFATFPLKNDGSRRFALTYERTLQELGLATGEVKVITAGLPLPTPNQVLVPTNDGEQVEDWLPVAALPDEVASVRVERSGGAEAHCVDFEVERIVLEGSAGSNLNFLVDWGPGRALVGTTSGVFYSVTEAGPERLPWSTNTPNLDAYYSPTGDLWLVGTGTVAVVLAGTTVPEARPGLTRGFGFTMHLDGAASGDLEMFVLADSGALERFDGTSWTFLGQGQGTDHKKGSLTWAAPGEAFVTGFEGSFITRYANGTVANQAFFEGALDGARLVQRVPGFGVLLGSNLGEVAEWTGATWRIIQGSRYALPVKIMAPFKDGFVYGGPEAFLSQYSKTDGFCAPRNYGGEDWETLIPHRAGFLATVRSADRQTNDSALAYITPLD